MTKLIISLLFAIMFIIFASQNMGSILVHFIFGPPVKVPTIVLVFSSFMLGMIVTLFFTIANRSKKDEGEDDVEEE